MKISDSPDDFNANMLLVFYWPKPALKQNCLGLSQHRQGLLCEAKYASADPVVLPAVCPGCPWTVRQDSIGSGSKTGLERLLWIPPWRYLILISLLYNFHPGIQPHTYIYILIYLKPEITVKLTHLKNCRYILNLCVIISSSSLINFFKFFTLLFASSYLSFASWNCLF